MSNVTDILDSLANSTLLQNITDPILSTATVPYRTTLPPSTASSPSTTSVPTSTSAIPTTESSDSPHSTATSLAFISLVVFVVAVALIAKIVISHKKKRAELIGGSARWRISASSASSNSANNGGNGGGTTATYLPMGRGSTSRSLNQQHQPLTNGLDNPGPDRLDWERQFFDDSEATNPPRLVFR